MPTALKRKQVRVYLDEDDAEKLEALAKQVHQPEAWCVSTLVSACVQAAAAAGYNLPLPLTVTIAQSKKGHP